MFIKLHKFPNGATLIYRRDNRANYSAVEVGFLCGSIKNEKNGVAHMLEHMMFKGTTSLSQEDINRERSVITSINAATGRNSILVMFYKTNRLFGRGLKFVKEMLFNVSCEENMLTEEKEVVKEEYKRKIDKLNHSLSMQMSYNFTNSQTPEETLGNVEDIDSLSVEDLMAYKEKNFVANNFIFSYCGNYSFRKVKRIVEREFLKDLKVDETCKNTTSLSIISSEPKLIIHNNDDKQIKALCAVRCDYEKRNYFYEDMTSLLHKFMSRGVNGWHNRLRKEGLVYSAMTDLTAYDNEKKNAFFIFDFATGDADKLMMCLKITKESIESIVNGEITDEEFEDMLNNKIYSYDEMHAPPKEIRAERNIRQYIAHGDLREVIKNNKRVKMLKKLTKVDFIEFARKTFANIAEPYVILMGDDSLTRNLTYDNIKEILNN